MNINELTETRREKKARDKSGKYVDAQIQLFESTKQILSENNEIDLYEEYFDGEEPDQTTESLHTNTLRLFK